ncbi:MAG: hypothetical protein KF852_02060 [Saprospiraceae bacterium]|nr:hypothetical protein [Saprospiraceae bacterium]
MKSLLSILLCLTAAFFVLEQAKANTLDESASYTECTTASTVGIETVLIYCGYSPNNSSNWECVRTEFDDGGECTIAWSEGQTPVIIGPDC